ncbi:MAG TPA: hypothetical protein VFK57_17255 [Vicinamibacterales bacterium]|nr:hypothetical protein [Vicinamibacterales bacterium]
MAVKKAARTKKTVRGKKTVGLTSALGPKVTTMLVCVTIAAGITVAARQQQARAKERLDAARAETVAAAEPVARKKPVPANAMASVSATAPANAAAAAPVETGTSGAASAKPVTVVGCLERTDAGYRLKDTTGDAPKARSWKSGFLKKSSASLDVVDASRTLQLAGHVGRRVSVTGTMVDREMQARSLRRLGECKAN